MTQNVKNLLLSALACFGSCLPADAAELKLGGIFTDGAVLQRNTPVPVWGVANPGQSVQLTFGGQTKSGTAGADGRWTLTLAPMAASAKPQSLSVSGEGATRSVQIDDVLIGEVWLCSGQSNMAMIVDRARDHEREKADADLPGLRVFTVQRATSLNPLSDCSGAWVGSSPETAGRFSAIAFFFGRELHRELDVPIGLIVSAWSGSAIEAWTSREIQEKQRPLSDLLKTWRQKDAAYTPEIASEEKAEYERSFSKWKAASKAARDAGMPRPRAPRRPIDPRAHWHHPTVLFNGMIAPLIPYAIRGAIWYQGETNAFTEESSALYELQLRLLTTDWRDRWSQGDFPMAWVQLPFTSARSVAWARIRESMRRATDLPNTGMAITLDLGEERLLHPKNKQAFAHRLALWARAQVYNENIAWSGPLPVRLRIKGSHATILFQHTDGGLIAKNGAPLKGFEIQDGSGEWHPSEAAINGNSVITSHADIQNPTAVRYAWANHPDANLFNEAGLPASPFFLQAGSSASSSSSKSPPPQTRQKAKKPVTDPPTKPPLDPVDIANLPTGTERLEIFLLMGQSNMKGRGIMPDAPLRDPRIVMMHRRTDGWFLARHPLHLVGSPMDFSRADNAGVGPGLAFAESLAAKQRKTRVALIPSAVGGTRIGKWKKGQRLYEETIRRARLALKQGPPGKTRIAGAFWLQGESDSNTPKRIAEYPEALTGLIDNLRADLGIPDLPFIAATIGEMRADIDNRKKINAILLGLPDKRPHTACVDARAWKGHIGDKVHYDTATQEKIGRGYAAELLNMTGARPGRPRN